MNLENFIDNVTKLLKDDEMRKELERGLRIQLTIGKEGTNVIVLKPETIRRRRKDRHLSG